LSRLRNLGVKFDLLDIFQGVKMKLLSTFQWATPFYSNDVATMQEKEKIQNLRFWHTFYLIILAQAQDSFDCHSLLYYTTKQNITKIVASKTGSMLCSNFKPNV